jgi:hypothetical protein
VFGGARARGSAFRDKDGNWNVPYASWNGSEFNPNGNWLTNDWNSNYRVVLLVILFLVMP